MGTPLAPEDGSEIDLLEITSQTLRQMAEIARTIGMDEEEGIFYIHLRLYCMRFEVCIVCARQTSSRVAGDAISRALSYLDMLIPETGLHELQSCSSLELRLRKLNIHWNDMRAQTDNAKAEFVGRWLKLGSPEDYLTRVEKGLKECADMLEKQHPENAFEKPTYELLSIGNHEPSYAVWKTAQALFDALLKCKSCSCSKQHDIGAKLELGTYRKPEKIEEKKKAVRILRNNTRRDGDRAGELDFDMFLSLEHDWHEVHVQTIKDKVVGFAIDGQAVPPHEAHKRKRVEYLCKSINSTKSKAWQRLVLKLTRGKLFNERIEKSKFWIDKSTEPISLLRCFEERHEFFTEKTKRILSLIIGYAVLHLNGTSWLPLGWGSANIKFFQTTNHKTPLRPFIQVDLPEAGAAAHVEPESNDDEDTCLYDLDSGHCCPALIALAVVLMEVYFAKPFTMLANMNGIPLENPGGQITLFDVDQVFNGEEENKVEGWRSQIPEDSPLLMAIDNCLNPELWEDEEGNALDNAMLKSRIYKDVVRLLELHLTSGFSEIPLDDVDNYARDLDFGKWGQAIDGHDQRKFTSTPSGELCKPQRTPSPAATLLDSGRFGAPLGLPEFQRSLPRYSQPNSFISLSSSLTNQSSLSSSAVDYRALQFFDDEIGDGGHFITKTKDYLKWRSEYNNVYEKFITAHLPDSPSTPVKIAILDTGIDRDHDAFEAREENIKSKLNFHNNTKKAIPDLNGHGTFTASLILDYAPDAELYIAKIADRENVIPNAKLVVDAINHAIDSWNVDVISLSFGWPSTDFEGYEDLEGTIERAYGKKILIFAAASNSGGRLGRAYPASSPKVICVHSTDALGNASAFSPTAERYNLNFATVGESVESAWPMLLFREEPTPQKYVKSRSGTSYATPIMAGIAAFLLQYARLHLPTEKAMKLKIKENMEALLRRCAERGPDYVPRDGYFYVELSLNRHNLFGGKLDEINYEILKTQRR